MARIRTVKPEFFRHYDLFNIEKKTGLPVRISFLGLLCATDREGRFKWNPRLLKLDCLPYDDDVDFEKVLNAMAGQGNPPFLLKYQVGGQWYGEITGFKRHQIIPHSEPPSEIPGPDGIVVDIGRFPTEALRRNIYRRDKYTCVYCGLEMADKTRMLSLDHVIPVRAGGTHHETNLVTCCKKCNTAKGSRNPSEAGMVWPQGFGEKVPIEQESLELGLTGGPPPVNTTLTREGEGEKEGERKGREGIKDFVLFWALWPKKVDKLEAEAFWNKMPMEDQEAALKALPQHVTRPDWLKEDGQYIPGPAKWLRKRKWEDQINAGNSGNRGGVYNQVQGDRVYRGNDKAGFGKPAQPSTGLGSGGRARSGESSGEVQ